MKAIAAVLILFTLTGCGAGAWWLYPVQPGCTCSDGTNKCCQ